MASNYKQSHFTYLFERVGEPLHLGPRGQGKSQILYSLPSDYLKPYQNHASAELRKLIPPGIEIEFVSVIKSSQPYDLTPVQVVARHDIFSIFNPVHQEAAAALRKILMEQNSLDNFLGAASMCRDSVNSQLWVYAFAFACINRKDMRGFRIPAFWEIMPDLFIPSDHIRHAHEQATLPESDRGLLIVDRNFSGQDSDEEHKLWYFREDVGVNSHHWHWHLVNYWDAPRGARDRKGELFYYMHHDMLARYDAERLANGLNRVSPLDLTKRIKEAYFPKLIITNSGIQFASRQENSVISSARRGADKESLFSSIELEDVRITEDRIKDGIDLGFLVSSMGERIPLTPERGIDILGDTIEASTLTPNSQYYGSVHNFGHMLIAFIHDPEFKYKERNGVMGAFETAVRDPVFFRWHKHIDGLFERYKTTQMPYTHEVLLWQGVRVANVQVKTANREVNTLSTHWMQSDIDLSRGLDFGRTNINGLGPVWARVTHLAHESFVYHLNVVNDTRGPLTATVRIFMAPSLDEHQEMLPIVQQRTLFMEMDKFTATLRPGENTIERRSEDSIITIPWEQTFRDLERDTENISSARVFCGCGWPNHLLVPRGTHSGMKFDLFVMLTNGDFDRVVKRTTVSGTSEKPPCRDSISFCGIIDELFPDTKPMGFPFDRMPRKEENGKPIQFLEDFVIPNSNMMSVPIKIFHRNETVIREGGAPPNMRPVSTGNTYNESALQKLKIRGN